MNADLNLIIAWLWIVLGFVDGLVQGLFFEREDWLGGYTSFKRRMYRLAHISFFGLGTVNLLFVWTAQNSLAAGWATGAASLAFAIGAITMPIACFLLAHWPGARPLFAVPVVSLLFGGILVLSELVKL